MTIHLTLLRRVGYGAKRRALANYALRSFISDFPSLAPKFGSPTYRIVAEYIERCVCFQSDRRILRARLPPGQNLTPRVPAWSSTFQALPLDAISVTKSRSPQSTIIAGTAFALSWENFTHRPWLRIKLNKIAAVGVERMVASGGDHVDVLFGSGSEVGEDLTEPLSFCFAGFVAAASWVTHAIPSLFGSEPAMIAGLSAAHWRNASVSMPQFAGTTNWFVVVTCWHGWRCWRSAKRSRDRETNQQNRVTKHFSNDQRIYVVRTLS